jgi:uncharacterized membrane protein YbhN (UPF0104 family)
MAVPALDKAVGRFARLRSWLRRHPVAVTVVCTLAVTAMLAYALWDMRDEFVSALGDASWAVLAGAVALQIVWLIARSEAWHVCVEAAGGEVNRRCLFRASAVGYLGNLFNANVGVGMRIAALRRAAPDNSPKVGTLVTAEAPILIVELALAAICSFTLIGPLGLPWWLPVIFVVVGAAIVTAFTKLAHVRREGFWAGLAVMRGLSHRNRIIALTMFATGAQVARNYLVLRGIGVDISVLDSVALLIGTAVVGLLPIGPTVGVATSVLILGANGEALVAAAGALLTATGAVGALCFAGWAMLDRLRPSSRTVTRPDVVVPPPEAGAGVT